jgi:hypothetical protein
LNGQSKTALKQQTTKGEKEDMASLASAFPILPGKLEQWTHFCQEMAGPRHGEYEASRKRLGITREVAYLQHTPAGDLAIVYIEAPDIQGVFQRLSTSQEPFDVWFREQVKEIHNVDFSQPPAEPLPEAIVDWRAS